MVNKPRRWYAEFCCYGRDTLCADDKLLIFETREERDATCAKHASPDELPMRNELVPVSYEQVKHKYYRDGRKKASYWADI